MRILEWVAIPFCKGSSWPRNWTWVSCITRRFFTIWATRETPGEVFSSYQLHKILLFHATENNVRWGTTGATFSICFCHHKWQILISEAHLTSRIRHEFTALVSTSVPQSNCQWKYTNASCSAPGDRHQSVPSSRTSWKGISEDGKCEDYL